MAVWRDTEFVELVEGSPVEQVSLERGAATRRIRVAWEDRDQARLDFIGYPSLELSGFGGWYIYRTIPHSYPGKPHLFCVGSPQSEGVQPLGIDDDDLGENTYAKLQLNYAHPTYFIVDDDELMDTIGLPVPHEGAALEMGWRYSRYITKLEKPSVQILSINKGHMWLLDTQPVPLLEGFPRRLPQREIIYTWHQVPLLAYPRKVIDSALGCINSVAFDGHEPETLYFDAADPRPSPSGFSIDGEPLFLYDVQFKFIYKPNYDLDIIPVTARGWNWVLRKKQNGKFGFVKMNSEPDGTGTSAFASFDFRKLFVPSL